MSFRLGLVGLCTSHPSKWVPIIRQMTEEGQVDVHLSAAWDSGQTRPEGFAGSFCREFGIPRPVTNLTDMVDLVDGVIVHTADWDKHIEQARPFVDAGKSVLMDKPMVGTPRDAQVLVEWAAAGHRITGGSSLRFAQEVQEFAAQPAEERGELHTAFAGCGTDEFNYGIHAYALLSGMMGPGIYSAEYLGQSQLAVLKVRWINGKIGLLAVGSGPWLPFHATLITTRVVQQVQVDPHRLYRSLLEACLPYLCGDTDSPPLPINDLLEPERTAMAARCSALEGGAEVLLSDLGLDDSGYDGERFAADYRRSRTG